MKNRQQWTLDKIKEKTLEMVKECNLDRMPSRKECRDYFHDERLTNAISKHIGWYKLAEELGLEVKKSETYFGKQQEAIAQIQLISMGYEVKRMPQNFPYDLLVNDCVKIDVKVSRLYSGGQGNFYSFNLEKPFSTCDIYMLYLVDDNYETKDILIVPSKVVPTNTQISVGESNSKYYKYSQQWGYISNYCKFLKSVV